MAPQGAGTAVPENFGYFPSLESNPPEAVPLFGVRKSGLKTVSPSASYFANSGKVTKTPPGDRSEKHCAFACAFIRSPYPLCLACARHLPLTRGVGPRPPFLRRIPGRSFFISVQRLSLLNALPTASLPFGSLESRSALNIQGRLDPWPVSCVNKRAGRSVRTDPPRD